jgi:SAM-dependent methyltransferase
VGTPDDIRLSFNQAVEIYDRIRPSYPRQVFEDLFDMLPPDPDILEVGPGTGQATKDLIDRAGSVHAIEIGAAMAERLRSNIGTDRLRITVGDFETVAIEPHSVDAVVSATAYHWISRTAQTDRPALVLRPGGILAVVDLIQVDSTDDAGFFAASMPVYERYGQGDKGPPHNGPPANRETVDPPIRAVVEADSRFQDVSVRRYDWNQNYTAADYRLLMLSYSVTQMMDEPAREGLLDDIERLIRSEFGGVVTRPLVVTLTTAYLST